MRICNPLIKDLNNYESHSDGTSKTRILIDGGYIEGGVYHFYLTDHLGNNRIVAKADGTLIQRNHYYPFGMAFAETPLAEQGKQSYKYNGKEFDQMHGLNLYDYSARHYESSIGRFITIDPLAEKYYNWSPYTYCANNPMKYIDPDGRQIGTPLIQSTPQQLQKDIIGQQYPQFSTGSTTLESFTRGIKAVGAFTVSISGKVAAFFSAEGEINATLIVSGVDKGLHGYASGSLGVEKDVNISVSATVEMVKPDNPKKFGGKDLEGPSTKASMEIPVKKVLNGAGNISVIGTYTQAESKNAGKIDGYGAGVSAGFGLKKIFGGFLDKFNISTQSTETKGFNTNSYKK